MAMSQNCGAPKPRFALQDGHGSPRDLTQPDSSQALHVYFSKMFFGDWWDWLIDHYLILPPIDEELDFYELDLDDLGGRGR